jgi:hypothetical protein
MNDRTHPVYQHGESIAKLATVVLGALYVLGVLVSNLQLMELGISDFAALQSRNILTGLFFVLYVTLFLLTLIVPLAVLLFVADYAQQRGRFRALGWAAGWARALGWAVGWALLTLIVLIGIFGEAWAYVCVWGLSWNQVAALNYAGSVDKVYYVLFGQFFAVYWHAKIKAAIVLIFILLLGLPIVFPNFNFLTDVRPVQSYNAFVQRHGLPHLVLLIGKALYFYVLVGTLLLFLFGYADEVYPNVPYNLGGGQPQVAELVLAGKRSDLAGSAQAWAPATRLSDDNSAERTIETEKVAVWHQSDKFIYASSLRKIPATAQVVSADLKLVRNTRYLREYIEVSQGNYIKRIIPQPPIDAPARGAAVPPPIPAPGKASLVWAQLHPDDDAGEGQLIARAVVEDGGACPALHFDAPEQFKDKSWPMAERWAAADGPFPVKVCELAYPGFAIARVGAAVLKPRPADPQKIVVIGDTGCRIADWGAQDCNKSDTWAFRKIAAQTAALKPDLVIHVGDYLYREAACGKDDAGKCGGSPHGDNWPTWTADFFAPAGALLAVAPWVMLRGNHEDMERAGAGWRLLLSPFPRAPIEAPWPDDGAPYALRFERLTLAILDVANAANPYLPQLREEKYARWMNPLAHHLLAAPWRRNWLVLHNPAWVSYDCKVPDCRQAVDPDDPVRAVRQRLRWSPPTFDLVLAGHTHMFQLFVPTDRAVPPQIVAGMGGTLLERKSDFPDAVLDKPIGTTLFDVAGQLWLHYGFGYMVLAKKDEDAEWSAELRDPDGKLLLTCSLAKTALDNAQNKFPCAPPL